MTSLPAPNPDQPIPPKKIVTGRAICIGFVFTIFINIWVPYGSFLVHSSRMTMAHLPISALIVFLFLLLIVNPLLRSLRSESVLNSAELAIIFAMIFVATLIPGKVFVAYLFGVMATPHYYANIENQWATTFFQYLPEWLVVGNHGNALVWFYEGLPPGASDIPWSPWITPLFWWTSFFIILFFIGACISTIMRKTWVEHERLAFPLAQLVVDLIREDSQTVRRAPPFVYNRVFQVGFGTMFFIMAWNIWSFWGYIPPIPIGTQYSISLPLMDGAVPVKIGINIYALCFAFLSPLEIIFSLWFFALFGTLEGGILSSFGLASFGSPVGVNSVVKAQFFGGFIVFVLWNLWIARHHIRDVFSIALRGEETPQGAELLSYRTAVFGLLGGVVYMIAFLAKSGIAWWIIPVFLVFLFILYFGMTRIIAQTGLAFMDLPVNAHHFTILVIGSGNIAPGSLTSLGIASAYARNWRALGLGTIAHVDKVMSDLRQSKRKLLFILVLTFVASMLSSILYTIYIGYTTTGAYNFGTRDAFGGIGESYYNDIVVWIRNADQFKPPEFFFMMLGGMAMLGMTILTHRFPGWPLAPVGFTAAFADVTRLLMFTLFVAWLAKMLLIRFGGVAAYRQAQPFAWGMLIGYCAGVLLGFVVDWIWFPGQGHSLHEWT